MGTVMSYTFSEEALERISKTVQAAQVLRDNLQAIAQTCMAAGRDEVVLALVGPDMTFGGAQTISRHRLRRQVLGLERGSWHLVFSAKTELEEIEYRCLTMEHIAQARLEIMQRRVNRAS
jgi:hypothetical protein